MFSRQPSCQLLLDVRDLFSSRSIVVCDGKLVDDDPIQEKSEMSHLIERRQFMVRTLCLACLFVMPCATGWAESPPNIILCMGDDHGWDETGYNGHPHLHTPVLDEMAATGLRLDNFYSAHPSCSPTRGSVLTGRHPVRYGTFTPNWSIRPEEISVAAILRKAGYTCGHFGKWHVGPVKANSPTSPGAMGFDEWLSHDNFFEMNPVLSRNGAAPQKIEGEGSEVIIDETIRFIGKAKKSGKPYCAVVWFGSPHEPYSGLEAGLKRYNDLPEKYQQQFVTLTSMETGRPVKRRLDKVLRERYAEITAMDRSIGKLRRFLKESGLRDNTILWYCGDNGVPGNVSVTTPFRGAKGQMYEGGIRVPGIIEWPARISKPQVTTVNAVTSDMLTTICDLVGQPLPDRPMDGISLTPLIDGTMTARKSPIYFWSYNTANATKNDPKPYIDPALQVGTTPLVKFLRGRRTRNFTNFHHPRITENDYAGDRVILDDRYKLLVSGKPGSDAKSELFDLRSDPAEKKNLIETKPDVARKMQGQLRQWQQSALNSLTGADYR
jgi:arylsulfatase A-like enzyme